MSKSRNKCKYHFKSFNGGNKVFHAAATPGGKLYIKTRTRRHARQKGKQFIAKELLRDLIPDSPPETESTIHFYYDNSHICQCRNCTNRRNRERTGRSVYYKHLK